jgi:general stress protein 26
VPTGLFFVRPQGDTGSLIAYDMGSGEMRFSLPPGMLSADKQHYLVAKTSAGTQLLGFDLTTGAGTPITQLAGQWELSGVSPTGRWAALTRIPSDSEKQAWTTANDWKTDVLVVDTQTGKTAHQMGLEGNFAVDTLSAAGDALFVIQYLPAVNPDHYQVRLVDLPTETLQDGALVDKRAPDEVMAGQRWQAVAPHDGSWLFTLYLRTKNNTAFIHALNTENKFTLCFDLPTVQGNTLEQLRAYTLALSLNGQTIYAANPALGIIAEVDLNSFEVTKAASFAPDQSVLSASAPVNYGVADKRMMYFTGGKTIWTFDVTNQQVKSLSTLDTFISGLGLGSDGQRLFVARPDQPPMMLDTASGQAFRFQ